MYIYPDCRFGIERYTNVNTGTTVRECLEAQLHDVFGDVPIRVLNGGGNFIEAPRRWESTHRGDYTAEQARETGITIWDYAAFSPVVARRPRRGVGNIRTDVFQMGAFGDPYVYLADGCNVDPDQLDNADCETIRLPETPDYEAHAAGVGAPFAQVRPREIALLFSSTYTQTILRNGSLEAVWTEAARFICDDEHFAQINERRAERERQEFITLARERDDAAIGRLREQIELTASLYADGQRTVTSAEMELRSLNAQWDAIQETLGAPRPAEELEAEWQQIGNHAHVIDMRLSGRSIIIHTDTLIMPHPTQPDDYEPAELGEYEITLNFGANSVGIRNLTNRQGRWDHPHVAEGSFCAGEWGPTVDTLLRERQFAGAANFIIDVLSTCNPTDSWGQNYTLWFR